jgi:RHS repeat-associated protein
MIWRIISYWLLGSTLALADLPRHSGRIETTLGWAFSGDGQLTTRNWVNSAGQTNRTQTLSWDAKGRLHSVTDLDSTTSGFIWTAVYDGLGRRLQTTTVMETNGVSVPALPQVINQYYDPSVEFLELAVSVNGVLTWKVYGPDANGIYGGMNGVGGLEAVSASPQVPSPIVSDIRGNGYALYSVSQGGLLWYSSRVTGYGAVPGYRPLPLGDGAGLGPASAWRGKWADITQLNWLGARYYDPMSGRFLGADPLGHDSDPSLYTFCNGDPIDQFDSDGRLATQAAQNQLNGDYGTAQGVLDGGTTMARGLVGLSLEQVPFANLLGVGGWANGQITAANGQLQSALDSTAQAIGARNDNYTFIANAFVGEVGTQLLPALLTEGASSLGVAEGTTVAAETTVAGGEEAPLVQQLEQQQQTGSFTGTIRNLKLAGQNHPVTGIPFNSSGFPDFSSVAVETVQIEYTGTRFADEAAANAEAGLESTPEGYTWHHVEDGTTMQLVPRDIHAATGHTGGFSIHPQ